MTPGERAETAALAPDDAFAVLADETRFEIIQSLWELYEPDDPSNIVKFGDLYEGDNGVSFSELYDRVGYGDTGNFNYHLERLIPHFVRRVDGGYELTETGFEIARAVVAGTVSERPQFDAAEIDEACPRCGDRVVVSYENHHINVSCSNCLGLWQNGAGDDGVLFTFAFPPTGLSRRTPTEAFHATLAYNLNRVRSFVHGVCPDCSSVVDASLDICEHHEPVEAGGCPRCHRQHRIEVGEVCGQCKSVARGPLTIAIFAHPTVTSFLHDHGVVHHFASWDTFQLAQQVSEDLLETDPVRIQLTVPCDDDRLQLTLDESLEVVDVVERLSVSG